MKLSRVSSWGVALSILSAVGCSSSSPSTGAGGAGGSSKAGNGGHGASGLGGKGGAAGGAVGGAAGNAGLAGSGGGGAAGAVSATGGAGGAAGGGGVAGGGGGGAAGGRAGAGGGGGTAVGGGAGGMGGGAQTADFSFSTGTTTALSLPPGGQQTIAITINRDVATPTFTSGITFSVTGTGVTGTFTPNPATTGGTSLALTVASTATPGSSTVHITGTAAGKTHTVDVPLTVTAPNTTLLVDFDNSDNNMDPTDTTATPSPSDTLFATLLQGENIGFNTFVVPSPGATAPNTPTTQDLAGYSTLIWYNGQDDAGMPNSTLSAAQEAIVEAWLDQGHKTMLVFSEQMFYALDPVRSWTTPPTNKFLSDYIGADGDTVDTLQNTTFNATGAASTPFAGDVFQIIKDDPLLDTAEEVNPKTGTDTLATVMVDPDGNGVQAVAVVVGRKQVGTAGTSTVVYVGIPVENIQMTVSNNTAAQFFHAVLVYAGLK